MTKAKDGIWIRLSVAMVFGFGLIQSPSAVAVDKGLETGFEDDLTINGQEGNKSDPDLEVKGYAGFGTNYSRAVNVTSGVGNVYIQNSLEMGSNLYVRGGISVGTNGFQINAVGDVRQIKNVTYSWPTEQGASNTFLNNDGAGNITWGRVPPGPVTFQSGGATVTWTSQPAALTEFLGLAIHRTQVDLTEAVEARITVLVSVAGFAGSSLRVQYATAIAGPWNYLDATAGPSALLTSAGLSVSSWVPVAVAARGDVFLRLIGIAGNGATSPRFGLITVQFR